MLRQSWLPLIAVAVTLVQCQAESKPAARGAARPAAKAPQNSAPAGKNNTAAYTAYLARLRGKLITHWDVPNGKNKVTLSTVVNADGSVGDVSLSSAPKNADAEIAGSEAFAKSQPLETVPGGGQVKLILTFESSADPHGDSNSNVYTQIVPLRRRVARRHQRRHPMAPLNERK
jgi:hypothetical protein